MTIFSARFFNRFTASARLTIAVAFVLSASVSLSQAATLYWEGYTGGENTAPLNSNWDVGTTANWNLSTEAGALTTFTNGDAVIFKDDGGGLNDNASIVIDAGGVSPASVTFNRGFGKVYTFTGGDILTGSMHGIRDDTKNFNRDGSYSFGGGTFITAGGSNFNYAPASPGTYNFGTGDITLSNGSFNFNPGSAATLTNNFVLNGGSVTGNANASFTGNLTIAGNILNAPGSSTFVFPSVTLGQDTTINLDRCCSVAPAVQFNSDIDGSGIHSITLRTGNGNADWTSRVGAPAGSWDVLNITKTQRGRLQLDANDPGEFFTGLKANGGTFYHKGGMIQFRTTAQATISTFDLDFRFMFDPDPAFVGPNANQTGAGFFGVTTLNVENGGVLGGNGTVARATGIGGNNPTFNGAITLNVNNGGTVAPGLSAGILNHLGDVNFNSGSALEIELGGLTPGTEHDQFIVDGNVTLDGSLVISFINGFSPEFNDLVTILSADSITGEFTNVEVQGFNGYFDVIYTGTEVQLTGFAIPEPSTFVLLGFSMLGCQIVRRRRKS